MTDPKSSQETTPAAEPCPCETVDLMRQALIEKTRVLQKYRGYTGSSKGRAEVDRAIHAGDGLF